MFEFCSIFHENPQNQNIKDEEKNLSRTLETKDRHKVRDNVQSQELTLVIKRELEDNVGRDLKYDLEMNLLKWNS